MFGEPSATGSLTTPLAYTTTFQAAEAPDRVELLTRVRGQTTDESSAPPRPRAPMARGRRR
ncbi:MAG: hypothetical protein R3C32_10680 [Chloroflexota bacterium]